MKVNSFYYIKEEEILQKLLSRVSERERSEINDFHKKKKIKNNTT